MVKSDKSSVVGEYKGMLSGLKSDLKDSEKKLQALISKSNKQTSDDAYKALNREVYALEQTIKNLPTFDSATLEKKWGINMEGIYKKIGEWKQFELKGEEIVDKVNALPIREEDQIGFEHIKGWKDTIGTFVRGLGLGSSRVISGGRSGGTGFYKLPLDGVTKSFTIPNFRGGEIAIMGSSFPTAFAKTTDYTVNGSVITFTDEIDASTTLSNGQTIIVLYNQLFFTK